MECSTPRRAALVLIALVLVLSAAPPAAASTGQNGARRQQPRAQTARRRHRRHRRHRHRTRHHRPAGVAVGSSSAPSDGCANSASSAQAMSLQTMRTAVICEMNLRRSAHGLPTLGESSALDSSAQNWSQAMVAMNELTHGADFSARITAAGYSWSSLGENIASGYLTPRSVVAAWMVSQDHCRNILTPSFRDIGVGEVPAGASAGPATWTADFGLRLLASATSGNWGPANGCPY